MENILNYLDDLFSHFPWNRRSSQIKSQLKEAMYTDYEHLLDENTSPSDAFEQVKNKVAEPQVIAQYIPNSFFDYHTLLLCLNIIIFGIIYYFTNNPNFLQIFLPVRLAYPTIIASLIQMTVLCPMMGLVVYHFYKFLPQKFLHRAYWQSCLSLFIATVLYALFFVSAIAFIWYTLSGYDLVAIRQSPLLSLLYFIYQNIILQPVMMWCYSLVIGSLFVISREQYHCPNQAPAFELSDIYDASFSRAGNDEITSRLPQTEDQVALIKEDIHKTETLLKEKAASLKKGLSHEKKKAGANKARFTKPDHSVEIVEAKRLTKTPTVNKPRTKNHAHHKRPQIINAKKQKITLKTYGPKKNSQ